MTRHSRRLLMLSALFALGLAMLPLDVARGHDGHDDGEHDAQPTESLPTALVLPALDGAKPWSDKPVLDDPRRFHFAVVTDRTGGHRPGIWMQAIERLNLLRPEFVVSVGDLIEGYTDNRQAAEKEWQQFIGFIDQLDMKFFFVAGNHDVTNPMLHDLWREHFGPEWYSFDYRDVHFVCLSSEDPTDQIGAAQLEWLAKDLAAHEDARWTMIFLHKPLWVYSERNQHAGNPDLTAWPQVETLLGDRPRTVFSGHVHHYVQYERHGMKYYHLATTGGGSKLRGVDHGEFDHVTWITFEPEGEPYVTHLMLDGILPPGTVTEDSIARFRRFLGQSKLEVAPLVLKVADGASSGRLDLRLANKFDTQITIEATIHGLPLRGLTVEPATLKLTAEPNTTSELAVDIKFSEVIDPAKLKGTVVIAKIRTGDSQSPLRAERTIPLVIEAAE